MKTAVKRVLDLGISLAMIIVLSPIFILLFVGLALYFRGNPFFKQNRPGLNAKPFGILKFKTMTDKVGLDGELLSDAERMTKIGKWVRNYSLDEIPQLINVIKGEMSLVGPRPLLAEYINLYSQSQIRRLLVLPGVTGWAQINGRNAISWEKKFNLDMWYVDNQSTWLDLSILFKTFFNVVTGKGVTQVGQVTVSKFEGSMNNHIKNRAQQFTRVSNQKLILPRRLR